MTDAHGQGISPQLVRLERNEMRKAGVQPARVELHVGQQIAWENQGVLVSSVVVGDSKAALETLKNLPRPTISGIPIVPRVDIPKDVVRFVDSAGKIVGEITNLSVPEAA